MKKDHEPGVWCASVSGHLDSGEAYDASAVREMDEEIGLKTETRPNRLFKIEAREETSWEFCWVYRGESDGPFALNAEEIERGDWFAPADVTRWMRERPQDFASALLFIWRRLKL